MIPKNLPIKNCLLSKINNFGLTAKIISLCDFTKLLHLVAFAMQIGKVLATLDSLNEITLLFHLK